MNRFALACVIFGLTLASTDLFAVCYGYAGPGGPCYAGPGGPQHHAYSAPGVTRYVTPGIAPPGPPSLSNAKKATLGGAKAPCPPNAMAKGVAGSISKPALGGHIGNPPGCTPATTIQATRFDDVQEVTRIFRELLLAKNSDMQLGYVLGKFFEPELADLLRADRVCKRSHHMTSCPLDFSPLWVAQNPDVSLARIRISPIPGTVRVEFRNPTTQAPVVQYFVVEKAFNDPIVMDIENSNGKSIRSLFANR